MKSGNIVRFIDLTRQYNAHREAFLSAMDGVCREAAYCDGKYVKAFEKNFADFCSVPYASCVNSGTSALFLAMRVLGIGDGDEVIVPASTFVSTAWAPGYVGAKIVFADCTEDTWEIDPNHVKNLITDKTKAIIGVHLYGNPFDAGKLKALAGENHLYLIEDCAQAHGALYQGTPVGGLGDIGCFSFYPTKNLGAFGEGGCLTSGHKAYIEQADLLKKHAQTPDGDHLETAYNMRMEGIQAAVMDVKLKMLAENNKKRRAVAARYQSAIQNTCIRFQQTEPGNQAVYHLFAVTVPDRASFLRHLTDSGIEYGVHYKKPCHLMKAFEGLGYRRGDLPNSEYLSEHCVSLPLYPEMYEEEIERVIDACNTYKA